jgi:hypothetical protein
MQNPRLELVKVKSRHLEVLLFVRAENQPEKALVCTPYRVGVAACCVKHFPRVMATVEVSDSVQNFFCGDPARATKMWIFAA